jgi:hypothetical protein
MNSQFTSPEAEENSSAEQPETKNTQPTETSSRPGKGRMVDVTDEELAFQFLGAKKTSEESV